MPEEPTIYIHHANTVNLSFKLCRCSHAQDSSSWDGDTLTPLSGRSPSRSRRPNRNQAEDRRFHVWQYPDAGAELGNDWADGAHGWHWDRTPFNSPRSSPDAASVAEGDVLNSADENTTIIPESTKAKKSKSRQRRERRKRAKQRMRGDEPLDNQSPLPTYTASCTTLTSEGDEDENELEENEDGYLNAQSDPVTTPWAPKGAVSPLWEGIEGNPLFQCGNTPLPNESLDHWQGYFTRRKQQYLPRYWRRPYASCNGDQRTRCSMLGPGTSILGRRVQDLAARHHLIACTPIESRTSHRRGCDIESITISRAITREPFSRI